MERESRMVETAPTVQVSDNNLRLLTCLGIGSMKVSPLTAVNAASVLTLPSRHSRRYRIN
jgi:hypothetical protein